MLTYEEAIIGFRRRIRLTIAALINNKTDKQPLRQLLLYYYQLTSENYMDLVNEYAGPIDSNENIDGNSSPREFPEINPMIEIQIDKKIQSLTDNKIIAFYQQIFETLLYAEEYYSELLSMKEDTLLNKKENIAIATMELEKILADVTSDNIEVLYQQYLMQYNIIQTNISESAAEVTGPSCRY